MIEIIFPFGGIFMIIDFHCHIGKSAKRIRNRETLETTPEQLIKKQKECGIDFSCAIPVPTVYPEDLWNMNELVLTMTHKSLLPFVWINPFFLRSNDPRGCDEAALISHLKERRVFGLKIHPILDGFYPDTKLLGPVFEIARALSLPILWHTGWGSLGSAMLIPSCARANPDVAIVIGHMVEETAPATAALFKNVYLETSYCSGPDTLAAAVVLAKSEKILFGSDFPVNSIAVQKLIVEEAPIPDVDKENILGLNAKRLLKL